MTVAKVIKTKSLKHKIKNTSLHPLYEYKSTKIMSIMLRVDKCPFHLPNHRFVPLCTDNLIECHVNSSSCRPQDLIYITISQFCTHIPQEDCSLHPNCYSLANASISM